MDNRKEAIDLLSISSEHRLRSENLAFDIDVWYPALEKFTFRSEFFPLTRKEADAILAYQDTRFREKFRLTHSHVAILCALEARLDSAIRNKFSQDGAFLRLCGRSPKDAEPLDRAAVLRRYHEVLSEIVQESGEAGKAEGEISSYTKLRAISRVSWLRVTNGAEAMSLLLTSERVYADLHDWLRWGEPEQVVLRQYEPEIALEYEFRLFVHRDRPTGLSQYDHYGVYPGLSPRKAFLQQRLLAAWAAVHPHVGVPSYVIDFAYLPRSDRVVVIELSPFLPCTGPALFHWTRDRQQLEEGPLEFRVLTAPAHPVAQVAQLVEVNWEQRWARHVPPYWSFYALARSSLGSGVAIRQALGYTAVVVGLGLPLLCPPRDWLVAGCAAAAAWGVKTIGQVQRLRAGENTASRGSCRHALFFYGTLKRGFHWHSKFLSTAAFVGTARTVEPQPLVVGECGVPYLLGDIPAGTGQRIRGEVWRVDDDTLEGLDEYEGVAKGYYSRRPIAVEMDGGDVMQAQAYFKSTTPSALRTAQMQEEYTLEDHKRLYRPIRHILVKQEMYLQMPAASEQT